MKIEQLLKLRKRSIEDFQQGMVDKVLNSLEANLVDTFNNELSTKKTLVDLERFNYFIYAIRTEEHLDGHYLSMVSSGIKRILSSAGLEVTKIEASQRIKPRQGSRFSEDSPYFVNCLSFIIHFSNRELGEM